MKHLDSTGHGVGTHFSTGTRRRAAAGWIMAVLVAVLCAASARAQDDEYVAVYAKIAAGDTFAANGKTTRAHAKYLEAQQDLVSFQNANPVWHPNLVAYRMRYLQERIDATAPKPPAPPVATNAVTEQPADSSAATPAVTPAATDNGMTTETTPATPATTTSAETTTSAAVKSPVKLIDAGSEPRAALRLHPAVGDRQSMTMTMRMGMTMNVGGQASPAMNPPAMVMTMGTQVKSVAPNGDITYSMSFDDATVSSDPNASPLVVSGIKGALAGLRGMSGTGTISEHGISLGIHMTPPPGATPQTTQMLNQMKDSFSSSSNPLPDEPVGAGAKWEYQTRLHSQGMAMDETIDTQLVSVQGDHLKLKIRMALSAADQDMQSPSMPAMKTHLSSLNGSGTGNTTLDLSHLMPPSATLAESTQFAMSVSAGGQKKDMQMAMTMDISINSK
jgi:hypothetical protein